MESKYTPEALDQTIKEKIKKHLALRWIRYLFFVLFSFIVILNNLGQFGSYWASLLNQSEVEIDQLDTDKLDDESNKLWIIALDVLGSINIAKQILDEITDLDFSIQEHQISDLEECEKSNYKLDKCPDYVMSIDKSSSFEILKDPEGVVSSSIVLDIKLIDTRYQTVLYLQRHQNSGVGFNRLTAESDAMEKLINTIINN